MCNYATWSAKESPINPSEMWKPNEPQTAVIYLGVESSKGETRLSYCVSDLFPEWKKITMNLHFIPTCFVTIVLGLFVNLVFSPNKWGIFSNTEF